jgi:hypothetical protein
MIVEKSPSSERSRGHIAPNLAESSDEVGFMIGDLTSRRTSPLPCDACTKPASVRYRGHLWCSGHATWRVWRLPGIEWNWRWA